jgi:hypothetical protein
MKEDPSNVERYQLMSPQERNAVMRIMIDLLPSFEKTITNLGKSIFDAEGKISDALATERIETLSKKGEDRKRSRLTQILTKKFKDLMEFSCTTAYFKFLIIDSFQHSLCVGISTEKVDNWDNGNWSDMGKNQLISLFMLNNANAGGIFEKRQAREIERKAYALQAEHQRKADLGDEIIGSEWENEEKNIESMKPFMENDELQSLEYQRQKMEEVEKADTDEWDDISNLKLWKVAIDRKGQNEDTVWAWQSFH